MLGNSLLLLLLQQFPDENEKGTVNSVVFYWAWMTVLGSKVPKKSTKHWDPGPWA